MQYIDLYTGSADRRKWVFVPVGCIEGHGAGLPVGTDIYIAKAFAQMFSDCMGGILFPEVFAGVLPNTSRFELSIGFTHNTVISILYELCSALSLKGFCRIVLVNIHKGNDTSIRMAVERLYMEQDIKVIYIDPYSFLNQETEIYAKHDNSYKETSLFHAANCILKSNVKTVLLADEKCERQEEMTVLRNYGYIGFHYDSESQHIAARSGASLEKGMEYMRLAAEKMQELLEQYEKL